MPHRAVVLQCGARDIGDARVVREGIAGTLIVQLMHLLARKSDVSLTRRCAACILIKTSDRTARGSCRRLAHGAMRMKL